MAEQAAAGEHAALLRRDLVEQDFASLRADLGYAYRAVNHQREGHAARAYVKQVCARGHVEQAGFRTKAGDAIGRRPAQRGEHFERALDVGGTGLHDGDDSSRHSPAGYRARLC
jgi:hypothetical protein